MHKPNFNAGDLVDHNAVSAIIKNDAGEVLVFFHHKYQEWTIPVGKAEQGQTVEDALRMEISEECGLELISFKKDLIKKYVYPREKKDINVELHQFTVDKYTGIPQNLEPKKHSNMQFMSVAELQKLDNRMDVLDLFVSTQV